MTHQIGHTPDENASMKELLDYQQKLKSFIDKNQGLSVSSDDTDSFINKQNRNNLNPAFGAALTTEKNYEGMGALGSYMKEATNIMDKLYGETKGDPTQKEKNISMGRMALKFFTQMGASASQPGQTALGAANVAGANVAQDYLNKIQSDRDKKEKLELAKKTGALGLATNLMSEQNKLALLKAKPQTYKSASRGDQVNYMTKENAKKYFLNYGMDVENPNFDKVVAMITASRDEMLNTPIRTADGKVAEIVPVYQGGRIVTFNKSAPSSSSPSLDYLAKKKRIENISDKVLPNLQKAKLSLIPTAQTAMDLLMAGEETGRFKETLQSFKEFYAGLFNLNTKELDGMQLLESISNRLAPGMREAGSGPMSDKDLEVFKSAILKLTNSPYANYISLYTFKRAKENMITMVQIEQEMLQSDQNYSQKEINDRMAQVDTGIYKKFKNKGKDGKRLYNDTIEDEDGQTEEDRALNTWMSGLSKGDVVLNRDDFNNTIYKDRRTFMVIDGPDTF